jgi:hypothetical protein
MLTLSDGLRVQHAAQLATLPAAQLEEWLRTGLIRLSDSRRLNDSAFLAVLLIKLLQANHIPLDAIRPLSQFLSERTREDIQEELRRGHTELLGVGDSVAFVSPQSRVTNRTSRAVRVLSIDVVALMRHARFLLDSEQLNWMRRN